jgi:hypothetical protein
MVRRLPQPNAWYPDARYLTTPYATLSLLGSRRAADRGDIIVAALPHALEAIGALDRHARLENQRSHLPVRLSLQLFVRGDPGQFPGGDFSWQARFEVTTTPSIAEYGLSLSDAATRLLRRLDTSSLSGAPNCAAFQALEAIARTEPPLPSPPQEIRLRFLLSLDATSGDGTDMATDWQAMIVQNKICLVDYGQTFEEAAKQLLDGLQHPEKYPEYID